MTGPLIIVALGTDHHRFDRLLNWVHEIAAEQPGWTWFVQHGSTPLSPPLLGSPLLGGVELVELMSRSDAVVCHAGPGLIMDARTAGHVPVVVPRDPELFEHVDHHQMTFAKFAANKGLAYTVTDANALLRALQSALAAERKDTIDLAAPLSAAMRLGQLVNDLLDDRHDPGHWRPRRYKSSPRA